MSNENNRNIPSMPDTMRRMVEAEVHRQLTDSNSVHLKKQSSKHKFFSKRTLIIISAATFLLSMTACAGISMYRLHMNKIAAYEIKTEINTEISTEIDTEASASAITIPGATYELSYLPAGIEKMEEGKYSFADSTNGGAFSLVFYGMDLGDDAFEMLDKNVVANEKLLLQNGMEGVYLEYPSTDSVSKEFNKKIYVFYPEMHYVLEMFIGENLSRDEAIKVVEGLNLIATEDSSTENFIHYYSWSEAVNKDTMYEADSSDSTLLSVTAEQMGNMHQVGESFPSTSMDTPGLELTVSEVSYLDSITGLDSNYMDENLLAAADSSGKLIDTTLQYIKKGNGSDSIDQIVKTRDVPQRIAYVTVQYKNTGTQEIEDVLVTGTLLKVTETQGRFEIASPENPSADEQWNYIENSGSSSSFEMMSYYDIRGGQRNNNHISALQPGETATVHMGFVITQEDIPYLLLNLEGTSVSSEFSKEAMELGYIDIRE